MCCRSRSECEHCYCRGLTVGSSMDQELVLAAAQSDLDEEVFDAFKLLYNLRASGKVVSLCFSETSCASLEVETSQTLEVEVPLKPAETTEGPRREMLMKMDERTPKEPRSVQALFLASGRLYLLCHYSDWNCWQTHPRVM
eukprot:6254540-Amphidinium_carterae.1